MIPTTRRISSCRNLWISSLAILSALLTIGCTDAQLNGLIQDNSKCFDSLEQADFNGDLQLNKTEYLTFLRLYGVPNVPSLYQDLPLVLQSTFFSISCICTTNGEEEESCCFGMDPYIPIEGTVATPPTQAQEIYLGRLCGLTDSAVEQVLPTSPPLVTTAPSSSPSFAFSASPSLSPSTSKGPTDIPTGVATIDPSAMPSQVTSSLPTQGASPLVTKIQTQYTIAIANGRADQINPDWFRQDLISAMDVVATEVAIMVEDSTGARRRLTVTVGLPTEIVEFEEKEWSNDGSSACPAALANTETDSCQQVTASVELFVDENQGEIPSLFGTALEEEIEAGRLEEALLLIDAETPVTILAGKGQRGVSTIEDPVEPSSSGLSTGALIGIGAVGAALLAVCIISMSKAKQGSSDRSAPKPKPKRQDDGKFVEATPSEEMKMAQKEVGSGLEWQAPRPAEEGDEEQPSLTENPWVKKKKDDGSVVSDAGWSDAYSSSMGTNESDDERDISSPSKTIEGTENMNDNGSASLEELEAAIQTENWAAVGASAALLAANQYDESDSQTNSKSSRGVDSSVQSSLNRRELDTEKTQELDNLIQSGDWEGVIQAAARFEAELGHGSQSVTVFEDSDSRSDSKESSRSGSFTIGSQFSSLQQSSAASGAGSRGTQLTPAQADFKREVQELVNKVVPEEADHVDDMIEQFKGRENELLETLRTMQERNIAQKARKAEQQRAKTEAKQMVKQARQEQTNADPGESAPAAAPIPATPAATPAAPATTAPTPVENDGETAPEASASAPVSMTPPVAMTAAATDAGSGAPPMVPTPPEDGVAPMTQEPTPFPAPSAASIPPAEAPANTDDEAAAAAADWAIAQALSNLQKDRSSLDELSNVVPDEDFDDEGSL